MKDKHAGERVLPYDVEGFIARRFAAADRETEPRLIRCAAIASAGSLEKLRYYVELLKIDYRDVIMAGEYTPSLADPVRVRDLNQKIGDEA